mgnify:FL=1
MKKWTQLFFSNIGKRTENQDFISIVSSKKSKRIIDIVIVCDGVGGRPNGHECSNTVGKEVLKRVSGYLKKRKSKSCLNENDLNALKGILSKLSRLNASPLSRTTLALVLVDRKKNKNGYSCIALWAGDSRIYAIEAEGHAFQISSDQYNEEGYISVLFSGDGNLIGEMGSKYICLNDPLLICATTDGMNCQLNGLYKYLVACLYSGIQDNKAFEKTTTKFLGSLVSDNYSAALLYKMHSVGVIKKAYKKISM